MGSPNQEVVNSVTIAAEAGKGTQVRELLRDMSFEEQFDVLKGAVKLNQEHTKTNSHLPDLKLGVSKNALTLWHDPEGWLSENQRNDYLYSVEFSPVNSKPDYLQTKER